MEEATHSDLYNPSSTSTPKSVSTSSSIAGSERGETLIQRTDNELKADPYDEAATESHSLSSLATTRSDASTQTVDNLEVTADNVKTEETDGELAVRTHSGSAQDNDTLEEENITENRSTSFRLAIYRRLRMVMLSGLFILVVLLGLNSDIISGPLTQDHFAEMNLPYEDRTEAWSCFDESVNPLCNFGNTSTPSPTIPLNTTSGSMLPRTRPTKKDAASSLFISLLSTDIEVKKLNNTMFQNQQVTNDKLDDIAALLMQMIEVQSRPGQGAQADHNSMKEDRKSKMDSKSSPRLIWINRTPSTFCIGYGTRTYEAEAILEGVDGMNKQEKRSSPKTEQNHTGSLSASGPSSPSDEEGTKGLLEMYRETGLAVIDGDVLVYPFQCTEVVASQVDTKNGFKTRILGLFQVTNDPVCRTMFGKFENMECTAPGSGYRRWEATLQNVPPSHRNWEAMCNTTPVILRGIRYPSPHSCFAMVKKGETSRFGFGKAEPDVATVRGVWEVEDESCDDGDEKVNLKTR